MEKTLQDVVSFFELTEKVRNIRNSFEYDVSKIDKSTPLSNKHTGFNIRISRGYESFSFVYKGIGMPDPYTIIFYLFMENMCDGILREDEISTLKEYLRENTVKP